jgi:hypothetical protein
MILKSSKLKEIKNISIIILTTRKKSDEAEKHVKMEKINIKSLLKNYDE